MSTKVAARPETIRQSLRHDQRFRQYRDHRLCVVCAAQAAWGHRLVLDPLDWPMGSTVDIAADMAEQARAKRRGRRRKVAQ